MNRLSIFIAFALLLAGAALTEDNVEPMYYDFSGSVEIRPPYGQHNATAPIPPGPNNCSVYARLAWNCDPYSDPDEDDEVIDGCVEQPFVHCELAMWENIVRNNPHYSIDYNFSNINLNYENSYMRVLHYSYDPNSGMFFDWARYEIDAEGTWNDPNGE